MFNLDGDQLYLIRQKELFERWRHLYIVEAMKKTAQNWLETSEYDLTTAEHMLKTGRHLYVVYLCHLSIEKILKAIVAENQDGLPPKTHNLYHLVKLISLEIPSQFKQIVADLNSASLPVRYPEDLQKLSSQYTQKVAEVYLNQTKECHSWLKRHPKLAK